MEVDRKLLIIKVIYQSTTIQTSVNVIDALTTLVLRAVHAIKSVNLTDTRIT